MSRLTRNWTLITASNPKSPISESYRMLRTGVDYAGVDDPVDLLMVTSCRAGEGKSTTSANMAVTFAQAGQKVLLIDADMRKPSQHHIFSLSNRGGLTGVLQGRSTLEQGVQASEVDNLDILTAGPTPPNPSEMLGSRAMAALLELAKEQYDQVIVDTPPILAVTDAHIVAGKCDGVVLVIDAGKVKSDTARKAKETLENAGSRMLGVVLNNVDRDGNSGYYYYYYGSEEQA
ncbi:MULTISPECIES: CpsD/CapB family tyrosine-protein kinase [unclassified Paenibacillus]|uniref:CpsD/CapB family tyrosine-protein kinase n=1 Tax=unclassified Paenibacillus TaxID=185978 RepID=UPI0009559A22|nr:MULTISPECIES: CpsD/CapB family tyrosine-protein kinase [unclassified Paenibacillus]ASS66734.1 CpsD/CapB family tyrosine-protein kinase [Paenibacillus sp. RUD330]SIP97221.1 capsular exopolysaccharide family [Paenibacillus sp. RU4X]SIQ15792.1 capsular exopolysaccharide family [Paenibacillus sp. RU4T]